jgi:hypothetical protein
LAFAGAEVVEQFKTGFWGEQKSIKEVAGGNRPISGPKWGDSNKSGNRYAISSEPFLRGAFYMGWE